MRRYWGVVALVFACFLIIYLVLESLHIPLLREAPGALNSTQADIAFLSIGLLIADVVLPVPSSLIMIANGALFGVVLGAFLSTLGSLGATMAGFAIGRWGGPLLARFVSSDEWAQSNQLLNNWGWLSILVTRSVPLLAETTAVLAGASAMRWRSLLPAALLGSLPAAFLYALTGATAVNFNNVVLSLGFVMAIAGIVWVVGRRARRGIWIRKDAGGET